MKYKEFFGKIKNDSIAPAYLFVGEEVYMMDLALERLKENYVDKSLESLNFSRIQGKDGTLDRLINACETLPFMASKKIVLVRDISAFLKALSPKEEKDFYQYMDSLGEHICLILMDDNSSVKKNYKIYKHFNKKNQVVEFGKLTDRDLNQWVLSLLRKHGKTMLASDINYFLQLSSYRSRNITVSLFELENALLKLINYVKDKEITREDIDIVLIKSIDTNIFELLDAINQSDAEKALSIFNEMYMTNEPILGMLGMITRQVRLMLSYQLYRQKGYGDSSIQAKLGIGNYEYRIIKSRSRKFTVNQLENIMKELLNVDIKIKTTAVDDKLLMEMLLVKMCNNK